MGHSEKTLCPGCVPVCYKSLCINVLLWDTAFFVLCPMLLGGKNHDLRDLRQAYLVVAAVGRAYKVARDRCGRLSTMWNGAHPLSAEGEGK